MNLARLAIWAQEILPGRWEDMEFGRIQTRSDWILPLAVFGLVLLFVRYMYKRDSVELPRYVGWVLAALRSLAFLGLLLIYLQPQWPNKETRIENSRFLLLVDGSQSMRYDSKGNSLTSSSPSRSEAVIAALSDEAFIDRLREKHDVVLFSFDEDTSDPRQVALLKRKSDDTDPANKTLLEPNAVEKLDAELLRERLLPKEGRGHETRLGQALKKLLNDERSRPISGVGILSDFGQNAGIGPEQAVKIALQAEIPLFSAGLGSEKLPANAALEIARSPERVFPKDPYEVEGLIRAQGLAGTLVEVELLSRDTIDAGGGLGAEKSEATQQVVLGQDGAETPVKFTLQSDDPGRRVLRMRLKAPIQDETGDDNEDTAEVLVIERKTRVLLFAGGPMREYRFLRNMLYRSKDTVVDVVLQSARAGVSQESNQILDAFPTDRQTLYDYDCIVAFDPNWTALDPNALEALKDWVAKEAGGLIVVAGPVQMRSWTQHPGMDAIRELYPVEFHRSFSDAFDLDSGEYGAKEPSKVEFTSFGQQAEFLRLTDSAVESLEAWDEFPGVYGYYPVRRAKPAATVYANFHDTKGRTQEETVYFAGQYYGQGRVFYMSSGEVWRLRNEEEAYYDRFWTKLLQHVSGGRLSRDSKRGELLVESQKYSLGSTVKVSARLRDEQLQPLAVPSVRLDVVLPGGETQDVELLADPNDPTSAGVYRGQFTVRKEGTYRLELPVPGSDEVLRRPPLEVALPDLERDYRVRNDELVKMLAQETGGQWYLSLAAFTGSGPPEPDAPRPIAELLKDKTRTITEMNAPTRLWDDRRLSSAAMYVICGLLCLEWVIRRLAKLA